jgi:hypothetical protein
MICGWLNLSFADTQFDAGLVHKSADATVYLSKKGAFSPLPKLHLRQLAK